ncbi:protein saal1 [Hyposmocoma kahamanoa]|uniref:protein saal1 n=1 Tax=Hyposmocoma kahamanoa TaxID=1477025 RepID=UPI000E6D9A01|nr:protein saal1 [Hyposmocoma kahamanoa]
MKPEELESKPEDPVNPAPIAGDVIGDTAYSERFVLKILLKFANLDTLKDEIQEKSFEDDLCTLWDMTAERDVVLFLQKHDVLNLFNFALPVIESARFIEIIAGIIGNMCCQKEVVAALLKMEPFITLLLEYMKSDDSLILVQVLRFVSSCLFVAEEEDIQFWMNKFENCGYSSTLYFILKNSSHKDLLVTALENFNTLTSYCNKGITRTDYFNQFVTPEAIESLTTAFKEIMIIQEDICETDEIERVLVISLQITLNLVGFDRSPEIYSNNKDDVLTIINKILNYFENKFVNNKEVDSDLVDIIESTNAIVTRLQLSEISDLDQFFVQSFNIWKALSLLDKSPQNGGGFEDDNREELKEFSTQIKPSLSTLISLYLAKCSESNLLKGLDEINQHYEEILCSIQDKEIRSIVTKRAANYRTRLKENVDS